MARKRKFPEDPTTFNPDSKFFVERVFYNRMVELQCVHLLENLQLLRFANKFALKRTPWR